MVQLGEQNNVQISCSDICIFFSVFFFLYFIFTVFVNYRVRSVFVLFSFWV